MEKGIKNTKTITVTPDKTAEAMGSGTLPVFATPAMVALMENTAAESVEALLPEGSTSVGTLINVKHLAADPVDAEVTCESELVETDGRKLTFEIKVFDREGVVGEAYHERFVIDKARFMDKVQKKL